jgi:hypothetical protein
VREGEGLGEVVALGLQVRGMVVGIAAREQRVTKRAPPLRRSLGGLIGQRDV